LGKRAYGLGKVQKACWSRAFNQIATLFAEYQGDVFASTHADSAALVPGLDHGDRGSNDPTWQDDEKAVLGQGMRYHLLGQVLIHRNKTAVFS